MAKNKQTDNMQQANGALPADGTIYDFMGKRTFPYKETNAQDYRAKLDKMTISDLEKEALEVAGIIPRAVSRSVLVDSLEREFLKKKSTYVDQSKKAVNRPLKLSKKAQEKLDKEIAETLSRGR